MIHPFLLLTGQLQSLHNPQTQSLHDSSILPPQKAAPIFYTTHKPYFMPTKMSDTTQKQEGFFFCNFFEIIKNLVNVSKKISQEISQIYYTMWGNFLYFLNPKFSQFLGF
jgi:hypothetical protein